MTTTEPDVANDPQAVIDAVVASWQAFNDAKLDPTNDDTLSALREVRAGELLMLSTEILARYRAESQRSRTNTQFPATLVPDPSTLVFGSDGSSASIESCNVNSNILVEIEGNDDGTDRVIDDSVSVHIETAELEYVDGRWVEIAGNIIERIEGATSCDL